MKIQIALHNVSLSINSKSILKNINLKIYQNDFIIISGDSGSGKTIIAKLLSGKIPPTTGEILINTNNIGSVIEYTLFDHLSVLDNILEVVKIKYKNYKKHITKCIELLYWLGINTQNTIVSKLNSSNKYLVQIAQSLILTPDLLILDDPQRYLDVPSLGKVINLLTSLQKTNISVIITSSNVDILNQFIQNNFYTQYNLINSQFKTNEFPKVIENTAVVNN